MGDLDWSAVSAAAAAVGLMIGLLAGWKARAVKDATWKARVDQHLETANPLIHEFHEVKAMVAVNQEQIGTLVRSMERLTNNVERLVNRGRE